MTTFDLTHFNPGIQNEADFLASFIARKEELRFFLAQVSGTPDGKPARHHLIIAPRGYGKTSLLRRIQIALRTDADLRNRFLPLTFREEQHNVISMDVFWRNCVQALTEAREDEGADQAELDTLDALWEQLSPRNQLKPDRQDGAPMHAAFQAEYKRLGRRPVLLIDNLDTLLAGLERHQWGLRAALQAADGPILISAAPRYPASMSNHEAAFFDFFRITTLQRLSDPEVMQCLRQLALKRGEKGRTVLQLLDNDPGRISALNTLAGGNPRTIGVLYTVLEAHMSDDILAQLSAMLDTFTGWYQARTEELPMQSRAVFDALALNWDPMIAADLAQATGLDTQSVSSQLNRLEKSGFVDTVPLSKRKKTRKGFQVSERFFNIWYLMRNGSRRTRKAVSFLTAFLKTCFSKRELNAMDRSILRSQDGRMESCLALATCISGPQLKNKLLDYAEQAIAENANYTELRPIITELRSGAATRPTQSADKMRSWFDSGLCHLGIKDFSKAEQAFRKAVEIDPQDADAWKRLGFSLGHLDNHEEAKKAFQKAIEVDPQDSVAWSNLGLALVHLDNHEQAKEAFRKAAEIDPLDAVAWSHLGLALVQLGCHEQAKEACQKATEIAPQDAGAWRRLGFSLGHFGNHEEAKEAFRKAVEIDPQDAVAWRTLAISLGHLGNHEEAKEAFQKTIEIDPQDADAWRNLGLALLHLDSNEQAKEAFRKAAEIDPLDAVAWSHLGLALVQLGCHEQAKEACQKATEIDPQDAGAWRRLGFSLGHFGNHEEAKEAFRKAVEIDPQDAVAWSHLGLALVHLDSHEQAKEAFQKAVEIDPQDSVAWNYLGFALLYLDSHEQAQEAFQKAIEIDPQNHFSWSSLGLAFGHLGNHEEAKEALQKAVEINPQSPVAWSNLGLAFDHLDNHEQAKEAFQKAIELDPQDDETWCKLGNLLHDYFARYDEARQAYGKALSIDSAKRVPAANLAYLFALHLGDHDAADLHAAQAMDSLSPAGRHLLRAALDWSAPGGGLESAWTHLDQAISSQSPEVWTTYLDELQRILTYAVRRDDIQALMLRMETAKYDQMYAPLYHAVRALVFGEDHLLRINPEVRGMADKIYTGVTRMLAAGKGKAGQKA